MENINHRIQSDDESLTNLGKRKSNHPFVAINDVPNQEKNSFGLPPDEILMGKEEGKLDANGLEIHEDIVLDKEVHMDDDQENDSEGTREKTITPVLMGGGKGLKRNDVLNIKQRFGPKGSRQSNLPGRIKPNRETIRGKEEVINEEIQSKDSRIL